MNQSVVRPVVRPSGKAGQKLYMIAAVVAAIIMLVGFSRSFYLKGLFDSAPLSPLFHIHGAVMTLWFVVLIVQVRFVSARRMDLHRRLGWFATALALLVTGLGIEVGIESARMGVTRGELSPLGFMIFPLSIITIFAFLVGLAIYYRRRPDVHKRLMILASLNMLTPAISRFPIPIMEAQGPKLAIVVTMLLILISVIYDTARNRRLHPVFGWGAGLLIVSVPVRVFMAGTEAWQTFAGWLIS